MYSAYDIVFLFKLSSFILLGFVLTDKKFLCKFISRRFLALAIKTRETRYIILLYEHQNKTFYTA